MTVQIIKCAKCGRSIESDSRFCEYCHHQLPVPKVRRTSTERLRLFMKARRNHALLFVGGIAVGVAVQVQLASVIAGNPPQPNGSRASVFEPTATTMLEATKVPTTLVLPTFTAQAATAPVPSATPLPTNTPLPTSTPLPTNTPVPTLTPIPEVYVQEGDYWRENGVEVFFDVTGIQANGFMYDLWITNRTGGEIVGAVNSQNFRLITNTGLVIDPKVETVAGNLSVRGNFVLGDGETLVIVQGGLLRFMEIADANITHVDFDLLTLTPRIQRAKWRIILPR